MPHRAPAHVAPKNIEVVNKIKSNLTHYADKIGKTEYMSSNYWNYHKKIKDLLGKLGTIEINVGTLHATKIGKVMSKFERQLHGELSDVARTNNVKWKSLLTEYRENFKKQTFTREVKEEPLSQDSYNNLLASQPQPLDGFSEYSQNEILANSQDQSDMNSNGIPRELEFLTSNAHSDEETESDNESNVNGNVDESTDEDTDGGNSDLSFFVDMRSVVTNVTEAISAVEIECTKMKTMLDYINNKLNDYETKAQTKGRTKNKTSNGFSKKKKKKKNDLHKSNNISVSNTTSRSPPTNQIATINGISKTLEALPSTKKHAGVCSGISTSTSTTNPLKKVSVSSTPSSPSLSSSKKINDKSCEVSTSSNISSSATNPLKKKASVSSTSSSPSFSSSKKNSDKSCEVSMSSSSRKRVSGDVHITDLTEATDTNSTGVEIDSPNSYSEENTLLYPVTVKEEDRSEVEDVEFYFHGENADKSGTSSPMQNQDVNSPLNEPNEKSKDKTYEYNDLNKKRDNIIKKLKNSSAENRAKGLTTEKIHVRDESGNVSQTFSRRKPVEENENTSNKAGCSKQFKSSVFEIDSDGFTVPNFTTQNVLNTSGNKAIVKGQQVNEEELDIDLDAIELENMMTFSQVVHESDDIDDVQKDNLLGNRKNRTAYNNICKRNDGVKYPVLMKSKGRMKSAHKASTCKKALKELVKKRRR